MRRFLVALYGSALFLGMAACGGGGSSASAPTNQPPAVDVTGTWRGNVNSSVTGTVTATLSLTQNGASVTGNYSTPAGQLGTIVGAVSGYNLSGTITPTQQGCTGSLSATGMVSGNSMSFSYNGSTSCGGPETGTGNLTKQ